jgi:type IV pilus assembly protein PilA
MATDDYFRVEATVHREEVGKLFRAIHDRLRREDEGFTLIELMVVVLIIAILIAIAIPTFLGARTKAQDRAAQVDLRQGLLTAKSYYTDNETFLDTNNATTATDYAGLEPSLTFAVIGNASGTVIGVDAADQSVMLAKKSKSGQWACVAESSSTQTVKFITTNKPAANPFAAYANCAAGANVTTW